VCEITSIDVVFLIKLSLLAVNLTDHKHCNNIHTNITTIIYNTELQYKWTVIEDGHCSEFLIKGHLLDISQSYITVYDFE